MVNSIISFFTWFLILCLAENVKSPTFPPKMKNCLDMISRDFSWMRRKESRNTIGVIKRQALHKKTICDMNDSISRSYFTYLRDNIKIVSDMETPTQYCQELIKNKMSPTHEQFYLKVAECLDYMAEYFLCISEGVTGSILSDDIIEIAKDFFYRRKESDFFGLAPNNIVKIYVHKLTLQIKLNDNVLAPKQYCLNLVPQNEREIVEIMDRNRLASMFQKQNSTETNNSQTTTSSGIEDFEDNDV